MLFVLFENLRSDRLRCDEESGSGCGLNEVGSVMYGDKSFSSAHGSANESSFIRAFLKPIDHLILMIEGFGDDSNGMRGGHMVIKTRISFFLHESGGRVNTKWVF